MGSMPASETPPNPLQSILGKRKDPTDNTKCEVCGDQSGRTAFGVSTCKPCANFFDRITRKANPSPLNCRRGENCEIRPETRAACSSCRLKKCEEVGMKSQAKTSKRVQLFCKVCYGKTPFEMACGRCRKLFGRLFGMPLKVCKMEMECKITQRSRLTCSACFYNNCLAAGLTSADIRPPAQPLECSPDSPATVPQVQYPEYQEAAIVVSEIVVQEEEVPTTAPESGPCQLCRRKPKTKRFGLFDGIQMCRRCTLVVTKNTTGQSMDVCQREDGNCRQKRFIVHCFACLFKEYNQLKGGINLSATVPQDEIVTGLCKLCDKVPKNIPHEVFNGIQMCRRCKLFIRQGEEPLEECKDSGCKNHFPVVNCLACIFKKYKKLMEPDVENPEQQALTTVHPSHSPGFVPRPALTVWKRDDNGTYYNDLMMMKDPTTVTHDHRSLMIKGSAPQGYPNQGIHAPGEFISSFQEKVTEPEMYQYQAGRSHYPSSQPQEPEPEMYQYRPVRISEDNHSENQHSKSTLSLSKSYVQLGEESIPKVNSDWYSTSGIDKVGYEIGHHPENADPKQTIPLDNSDHYEQFWNPPLDTMLSVESYLSTFNPMESPLK
ncbi:hypothetical protein CAEBREN_04586 [Caenorhabditis brenneri]|uniref:Nuclear receptor domain-containing protein n=1 Tax=Caenorhabditis brenneri TaxID=135651 RepID=G0MD95_CAEBE|nr:hypothetical protein CAEBREN_04586 [Caenorhabditis brenneri]